MSPAEFPEKSNSRGMRFLRVAPLLLAISVLGTWAASNYYEQSAKGIASGLADARRDASSLRTSMLLSGRMADLRLLLAATHNADCSDALKPVPTVDERTSVEAQREQDRLCATQLNLFKLACGSDTRNLANRIETSDHFANALTGYEAIVQPIDPKPYSQLKEAREAFRRAYAEQIAPIGPIAIQDVTSARRNCNALNPLMRRQRDFRAAWEPFSQQFEIEQYGLADRYEKVMNSLSAASSSAENSSRTWHRIAIVLSVILAVLLLILKWFGLDKSPGKP